MEPSLQACQNLEINHMFPPQLAFFQGGSGSVECQKKSVNLTSEKEDKCQIVPLSNYLLMLHSLVYNRGCCSSFKWFYYQRGKTGGVSGWILGNSMQ